MKKNDEQPATQVEEKPVVKDYGCMHQRVTEWVHTQWGAEAKCLDCGKTVIT